MTDEEIRRIRRLVVGELPTAATAPRPVDPRHEERFRRALAGPRRATGPTGTGPDGGMGAVSDAGVAEGRAGSGERASASSGAPFAAATATPDTTRRTRSDAQPLPPSRLATSASPVTVNASPRTTGTRPVASPLLRKGARGDADIEGDDDALAAVDAADTATSGVATAGPGPNIGAQAVAIPPLSMLPVGAPPPPADLSGDWANGLADTVLTLCTGSDPSFHSWTIQVPIDSAALPHTELRMTFSRHHLLLRFSTQSTQSYALISAHQSQLHRLLRRDLPGDRHIDIELT